MNVRKSALAAGATALTLALAACSGSDGGTGSSSGTAAVGVSHIHGLGADPSGRQLYVATHEGVYTPGAEGPVLVGESKDDFMGFTVAEDGTFYASGHPAPGTDAPGNKGLIESSDEGRTWSGLSLEGTSDFHALEHAHNTLYGYDATNGLLRTSKDGVRWKDGASLQALDIAVDPENADVVLATTEQGVARSTDGGRTFAAGREPAQGFVSWPAPDALYGIDASGELSRSSDGGTTWRGLATVPGGQPQALTAVSAEHVLAATQDGVYESKDGGRSFDRRMAVESGAS